MAMDNLKPCPFCDGKAKVFVCDGSGSFYADIGTELFRGRQMSHCLIKCQRCGVRTKAYLTRRGVFNAWNKRKGEGDV